MNPTIAAGKFDQFKGKAKQSIGEALGNDKLADSGAVDQVKGAAKEAWGNAKDAIQSISDSVKTCASSDAAEATQNAANTSHDIRARLTSTAQNVKDTVSAKAQQIQRDLQRPTL
jgi:uncharacterized protein YjbJ (UPF0337 family)